MCVCAPATERGRAGAAPCVRHSVIYNILCNKKSYNLLSFAAAGLAALFLYPLVCSNVELVRLVPGTLQASVDVAQTLCVFSF